MTNENLITALAGVLVVLPNALPAVAGLNLTPEMHAVLLILSLVGGAILKVQPGRGLSDDDVRRIAVERERLRREERDKIRAAGEQRG